MTNEIDMVQSEDVTLELTVTDSGGTPINLTGRRLEFTVRKDAVHKESTALITKSSLQAGEIDIVDAPNGRADILLVPNDTTTNNAKPGKYYYDVWLIEADTTQFSIIQKTRFTIGDRITKVV